MYKSAERNWKNYGCVEVVCKVPETRRLSRAKRSLFQPKPFICRTAVKSTRSSAPKLTSGQITPESQRADPGRGFYFYAGRRGKSDLLRRIRLETRDRQRRSRVSDGEGKRRNVADRRLDGNDHGRKRAARRTGKTFGREFSRKRRLSGNL